MQFQSKVAKAVRLALIAGAGASLMTAPQAFAAEEGAEDVERISVTGSRIKRTDMESASPVSVFTAADIEASGEVTLEGFVRSIPAINGAVQGKQTNNGSNGTATASLRGLGSGRTLVLINGRRFASSDLNSIPVGYIERVEVVRDGASTIYGSDAIAGVINFITKKDFEGVEFKAQYDVTDEDDGEIYSMSVTTGASSDKGNVVLSLGYTDRGTIFQGDRGFSECPIFERDGEFLCGGSGTIPYGQFLYADASPAGGYVKDPSSGTIRPFDTAIDAFNYATTSKMVTPAKIYTINAAAQYEIMDDVTVFTEGGMTNRKSNQLMAPEGTFWGPTMPASNPYNPTGEDLIVYRRLRETAGRFFSQDSNDYRMAAGIEGMLDNGWEWDVSFNYARWVDTIVDTGRSNPTRVETLLDPDLCAADSNCPGVWNILEAGTLTEEMQAYALVPNSPVRRKTVKQLQANLMGDSGDFELPGGAIGWAAGFERRWDSYQFQPDGAAGLGQIYGVAADPTNGEYEVDEVYGEISAPVWDGVTVTAAIRYTDYDFLSDAETNTKLGIEWTPFDGLLLRGTFAEGFRAPSITELFRPQEETNLAYNDPCENWGDSDNANYRANCAATGVPDDLELSSDQTTTIIGGNPDLEPETSESLTLGAVYSHDSGFSMALDYFTIEIENGIGTAGTNNVIQACYGSDNFSSPLCQYMQGPGITDDTPHPSYEYRNALGNVSGVLLTNANLATFETSGLDFDFGYNMEIYGGDLKLGVDGTYMDTYDYTPLAGADKVELAGTVGADQWETTLAVFAELRANFRANFSTDDYAVFYTARYQSEGKDEAGSGLDNVAEEVMYHDIQGNYYLDNYTLTAGIRNLMDEEPDYISGNQDMNTLPDSYDTAGRYLYAGFSVKF